MEMVRPPRLRKEDFLELKLQLDSSEILVKLAVLVGWDRVRLLPLTFGLAMGLGLGGRQRTQQNFQ